MPLLFEKKTQFENEVALRNRKAKDRDLFTFNFLFLLSMLKFKKCVNTRAWWCIYKLVQESKSGLANNFRKKSYYK